MRTQKDSRALYEVTETGRIAESRKTIYIWASTNRGKGQNPFPENVDTNPQPWAAKLQSPT